jgi:hypothetical protein
MEPDSLKGMEERCRDAERAHELQVRAHRSRCPHCGGKGRDYSGVHKWLAERANRKDASASDFNLYSLWVGASADTHQLAPNRYAQADGNFLELPPEERGKVVTWAIDLFLDMAPRIANVLRPEAIGGIEQVRAWLERERRGGTTTTTG